jgi:hypothetical protein
LSKQGYVTEPIYQFEMRPSSGATYFSNVGQFGHMNFGGPDFDDPIRPESLTVSLPSGPTYTYVQYMTPESTTCHLLFFAAENADNRLIADFDIAQLNDRIGNIVEGLLEETEPGAPLFCLPYGWSDVNRNGKPDMPVTILWANSYNGGEVHVFEITDDETVVDLTAGLPGPVYHWEFLPTNSTLLVVDRIWARHDCLYPDSPFGFWLYEWNGTVYTDTTANYTFSEYLSYLEDLLEAGQPFEPNLDIGPLVSLLLTYDYGGQREVGWQKFIELADPNNWPGSEPEALAWLQHDVAHLTAEYEAGLPFTPNNFGCP